MSRRLLLAVGLMGLVLAACAAGANPAVGTVDVDGHTAGFFLGLWQGFIAPFTLIISFFTDHVNVYEVHNSGNWYDFGFLLGLSSIFGGGVRGTCRKG